MLQILRVAVYTIAKNEAKHAKRWADSCANAAGRFVLDTGSHDGTFSLLKDLGVTVETKDYDDSFRFDVARNDNLAMIDRYCEASGRRFDLLLCLDMDEVLPEGWLERLSAQWQPGCTRARYDFIWNHDGPYPTGAPLLRFKGEKIHTPGHRWIRPCHEVLTEPPGVSRKECWVEGLEIHHWADNSKPRTSYLPLLRISAKENPDDARACFFLARELFFYNHHGEAIQEFSRYRTMTRGLDVLERAAAAVHMSRSHEALKNPGAALAWALLATMERPDWREGWLQAAKIANDNAVHEAAYHLVYEGLARGRIESYLAEPEAYRGLPWDLLGVACFYTGRAEEGRMATKKALDFSPDDTRLKANLAFFDAVKP